MQFWTLTFTMRIFYADENWNMNEATRKMPNYGACLSLKMMKTSVILEVFVQNEIWTTLSVILSPTKHSVEYVFRAFEWRANLPLISSYRQGSKLTVDSLTGSAHEPTEKDCFQWILLMLELWFILPKINNNRHRVTSKLSLICTCDLEAEFSLG